MVMLCRMLWKWFVVGTFLGVTSLLSLSRLGLAFGSTNSLALVNPRCERSVCRFYPQRTAGMHARKGSSYPPHSRKRLLQLSSTPETSNEETDDPDFQRRNQQWVVLVDDEESIRFAVGDFLYGKGYEVTACADANSLLELIASKNSGGAKKNQQQQRLPDIIISDVRMPESDKNGYELVQFLRSAGPSSSPNKENPSPPPFLTKLKTVPIVLLTAKAMTDDRIQGYRAGADVVLPKPFSPDELIAIIDNLILRRQQRLMPRRSNANPAISSPSSEDFRGLKEQLDEIKALMQQNAATTVQKTNVVLTDKERTIVRLLSEGYTPREVQASVWPKGVSDDKTANGVNNGLNTTPSITTTANNHNNSIHKVLQGLYERTETESKTELIRWARKVGYLDS